MMAGANQVANQGRGESGGESGGEGHGANRAYTAKKRAIMPVL